MKELIKQAVAGGPHAPTVLLDKLLEEGWEQEPAIEFIHALMLGRPPVSRLMSGAMPPEWKPAILFDTVVINGAVGARWSFFRDLAGKTEAHTNFNQPRRLNIGDAFALRRITLEGPTMPAAQLRMRINRYDVAPPWSVGALMVRGFWGVPVNTIIKDNDDISAEVTLAESMVGVSRELRLSLHGWLREPLGH